MTPHTLPTDWQWVTLGEIMKFKNGFAFKSNLFTQGGIPIIRIQNIQDESILFDGIVYCNPSNYKQDLEKYIINPNDILIAMSGATTGKVGIYNLSQRAYLNQRVGIIRIDSETLRKYVFYFLIKQSKENLKKSLGTAQPNLSTEQIQAIPIPLPPLEIQKQIVEVLESKLEKIQETKALLESSLKDCETYRASLLESAFRGELTPHSTDWQWVKLGECLQKMTTFKFKTDTFSYIDIESIDNKTQTIRNPKILSISNAPSRAKRELMEGDTLFSMVRPYLKNIAFVSSEFSHCVASTGFYVCRPKQNIFPRFLFFLMNSPLVINGLNSFMRGDNSPSIRANNLENFPIPLPPLEIQKQIVEVLESKLEKIQEIKALLESSLKDCETYRASLLESAFRGELV